MGTASIKEESVLVRLGRKELVQVHRKDDHKIIYHYSPRKELVKVRHFDGNKTSYSYNWIVTELNGERKITPVECKESDFNEILDDNACIIKTWGSYENPTSFVPCAIMGYIDDMNLSTSPCCYVEKDRVYVVKTKGEMKQIFCIPQGMMLKYQVDFDHGLYGFHYTIYKFRLDYGDVFVSQGLWFNNCIECFKTKYKQ